jgi:uncharacterized repeat protein (TIGR03943 family)
VRREAANVLLVLVGGALVKITVDGTYLRYVRPATRPWLLAAGITIIALAAVAILRDVLAAQPSTDDAHHHGGWWAWLLLLPVLAIFLIAPPALGADAVLRDTGRAPPSVVQRGAAAFPPLPAVGVPALSMSEFITRSVWDSSHSLAGRTVALTGFVVHDHGASYVARLVITCCAADATPMRVALAGAQADGLPNDTWIRVAGRLRPGSASVANGYTPTLVVFALAIAPTPADPYEY